MLMAIEATRSLSALYCISGFLCSVSANLGFCPRLSSRPALGSASARGIRGFAGGEVPLYHRAILAALIGTVVIVVMEEFERTNT